MGNPRRHYGSSLASTKAKRQAIRFQQHSPNSGAQVGKLNRTYTRKVRYVTALVVTSTGGGVLGAGVTVASFKGYSTNPNRTEVLTLSVTQSSGPNQALLSKTTPNSGELDVSLSGLVPGVYVFSISAAGSYARSSGSATLTITAS